MRHKAFPFIIFLGKILHYYLFFFFNGKFLQMLCLMCGEGFLCLTDMTDVFLHPTGSYHQFPHTLFELPRARMSRLGHVWLSLDLGMKFWVDTFLCTDAPVQWCSCSSLQGHWHFLASCDFDHDHLPQETGECIKMPQWPWWCLERCQYFMGLIFLFPQHC